MLLKGRTKTWTVVKFCKLLHYLKLAGKEKAKNFGLDLYLNVTFKGNMTNARMS